MQSNITLFADDTKMYVKANSEAFTRQLQDDLLKLYEWSNQWQLRFNPEKCTVLRLGKQSPDSHTKYFMKMGAECFSSLDQSELL